MNCRSQISFFAICLVAAGLMATSARADVTYTFSGLNDSTGTNSEPVGFQFTSSSFVTSAASFLQSQLSACTNCQTSSGPDVYMASNVPGLGDLLQFNDSNSVSSFYEFSAGAFGAVGSYSSGGVFNSTGKLTVAVPEPGSVALTFAAGLMLALFAFFRRKPAIANQMA